MRENNQKQKMRKKSISKSKPIIFGMKAARKSQNHNQTTSNSSLRMTKSISSPPNKRIFAMKSGRKSWSTSYHHIF